MSEGVESQRSRKNRTWDELPPKRRRFWLWTLLSLFLIAPIARIPLEMTGFSTFAATLVVVGLLLIFLVPLGISAWRELKERRAGGVDVPPAVSTRVVVVWAIAAATLWGVVGWVTALYGPFIPLLPLVVLAIAVLRFYQWKAQRV